MKSSRQDLIIEIISSANIETQNQLMAELSSRGVKTTQATLSRDIRDLHITKELSPEGIYRYVPAPKEVSNDLGNRLRKIFKEGVVSFDIAQNLLIIRTLPGLASACCSALDSMNIPMLVGTLAGDDTAFIAMKDNTSAENFYEEMRSLL